MANKDIPDDLLSTMSGVKVKTAQSAVVTESEDATAGMVQVMFRFPERQRDELRCLFARDGLFLSAGIRSVLMRHLREQ